MVKSFKTNAFFSGLKFSCVNALKASKIKLLLIVLLSAVAMGMGVFIAIKTNNNFDLYRLQEINLDSFYSGFTASSSAFFSRSLSLLINVALLSVLSLSPYLFPLACGLIVFRAYLFGLNFALIFIFYGIGSLFTAVIIILPCGLITLFALIAFYLMLEKLNCNCRHYGGAEVNRLLFIVIAFVGLIFLNLIETILLCVLNGKVILVI